MTPEQGNPATDNPDGSLEGAGHLLEGLLERDETLGAGPEEETPAERPAPKPVKKAETAPETQPEEQGEEAEEAPTEEGEAQEESGEEPRKYTVKVDGETREVSHDELIKGYQLEAAVTRKSMELAEQRKSIQAEREKLTQIIPLLLKQLDQGGETEPDWEKLRQEDEFKFVVERQAWQVRQERRNQLIAAQEATQAKLKQEQDAELATKVSQEHARVLEAIPEWRDEAKRKAGVADIRAYGKSRGFTDEELDSTYDSRALLAMHDAAQFRKLAKAPIPRPTTKGPRTASAGSSAGTPGRSADYSRMKSRVKETGSVHDAAAIFEQADL